MRAVFWLLALFAAAVAVSLVLQDGGYVVLVVPPWRIEVSLVFAIVLIAAAFALGYLVVRLVSHALALPTRVRDYHARKHERTGQKALFAALQALFEGRYGQVEKHAARAWESGTEPGLVSLVAARAAQRRRDHARRDEWMRRASGASPEWRRARRVAEAEQLIEERRFEEARAVLFDLQPGGPRHIATLQLLLRCEQGLGHWNEAVRLARALHRREALPAEAVESIVVRARTAELARARQDAASLGAYWRGLAGEERTHPRIAAAAARAFIELGDCRSAQRLLEEALERSWETELVLLYGECRDGEALSRIERAESWLSARPRDPDLLLTLGRLCMQRELWGKAQSYLESSLSAQPSRSAHVALAELFERLGRPAETHVHFRASADPSLAR